MMLLFKGAINLINLGMPTTDAAAAAGRGGGRSLINLTNKNRFFKYEHDERAGLRPLFGLKILYAVFLISPAGEGGGRQCGGGGGAGLQFTVLTAE